jgi:anti-sigma B factor antagonist
MNPYLTVYREGKLTVVEIRTISLMDPPVLDEIHASLMHLIEEEDRRRIVLDLERVQFISSQALGTIITAQRRLHALRHSSLVLCGVNDRLMELFRITKLDKVLKISPNQHEAVKVA